MTRTEAGAYPELRQLFGAYLNADFGRAYGSVDEALRAYRRETGAAHRSAALAELEALTASRNSPLRLGEDFSLLGCEAHLASPGDAWSLAATLRRIVGAPAPDQ